MPNRFTQVPYGYADAGNYGASATAFVSGTFSPQQISAIEKALDSGEMFIPPQIGMEALQRTLESFPSEDDHVWHILDVSAFTVVDTLPDGAIPLCTAGELAKRFASVAWDVRKEYDRLGLDD